MDILIERCQNLLERTDMSFVRGYMDSINWKNRLIGLKGNRGTGKTTLCLQKIKQLGLPANEALYVTLDDLYFTNHTLVDTAETFIKRGGKWLFLDEVHKYPGWSREVKNLYDLHPELQVVFTGSSILDITKEEGDLSRRVRMYEMEGLSFREYLAMQKLGELPKFTFEDLLKKPETINAAIKSGFKPYAYFDGYLRHGFYPFFKDDEIDYHMRVEQLVRTVIEYDMTEIKGFDARNARKLMQLFYILATQLPFKPNLTKLAEQAGLHRNTIYNYLLYLKEAKLIHMVMAEGKGINLLQKPEKVYLHNTNLAYAFALEKPNIGTIREVFVATMLSYCHALQIPAKGDFLVDGKWLFEVGGPGKGFAKIADLPNSYLVKDEQELAIGNTIPLWALGCLY